MMSVDSIAIMQPYFFPYIGYFQLIDSVEKFVFYDDVNFVKKGWINRNNILINRQQALISVPLIDSSQNKNINEILVDKNEKWKKKIIKNIEYNYKKSPFYSETIRLIEKTLTSSYMTISDLAINSVVYTLEHVGVPFCFERSSIKYTESQQLKKEQRLIKIIQDNGCTNYINAIGGQSIYSKLQFKKEGVNLYFLKPFASQYKQRAEEFTPFLSIIDVLMNNEKEKVKEYIKQGTLI